MSSGNMHRRYVSLLVSVYPKKSSDFIFYQAEVDYALGSFEKAAQGYLEVINSKKRRLKKTSILKSLLACLSGD